MQNRILTLVFILLLPLSQALCIVPIPLLYFGGTVLLGYLTDKGIEKGTEWSLETILKKHDLKNLENEQCLRLSGLECITSFQDKRILNKWWRFDYSEITVDNKHSIRYKKDHNKSKNLFPIFYNGHIFLVAMDDQEIEESIDEMQYISLSEVEKQKLKDIENQWNYGGYNE